MKRTEKEGNKGMRYVPVKSGKLPHDMSSVEADLYNEIAVPKPTKAEDGQLLQSPTKRRVGRPKKSETKSDTASNVDLAPRRRGRSSKTLVDDDTDYQPTESEVYVYVHLLCSNC